MHTASKDEARKCPSGTGETFAKKTKDLKRRMKAAHTHTDVFAPPKVRLSWYNREVGAVAPTGRGLLNQWIAATEEMIVADVIRWTEGIYQKRRRRNAKSVRIGERQITAEVLDASDDGWIKLLVRASVITKDDYAGSRLPPIKPGDQIKRARKTVGRGKPERLLWSDESARDAIIMR